MLTLISSKTSPEREKLEKRFEIMKLPSKIGVNYKAYKLIGDYIFIKCYESYYTISLFSISDYYEIKKAKYETINFEVDNATLLINILSPDETK